MSAATARSARTWIGLSVVVFLVAATVLPFVGPTRLDLANDCDMPLSPCTSRIIAPAMLLMAMPDRSSPDTESCRWRVAALITTTSTTAAPATAPPQTPITPAVRCQLSAIASTAPSDAPVETPSV